LFLVIFRRYLLEKLTNFPRFLPSRRNGFITSGLLKVAPLKFIHLF